MFDRPTDPEVPSTRTEEKIVTAFFDRADTANRAFLELKAAGIDSAKITVLANHNLARKDLAITEHTKAPEGAAGGAALGAGVGAIAGALTVAGSSSPASAGSRVRSSAPSSARVPARSPVASSALSSAPVYPSTRQRLSKTLCARAGL